MQLKETGFDGLYEIIPSIYHDERGFFLETFREQFLTEAGLPATFVQDNQSFSRKNVIRGLHLQIPPYEQIKLVRVAMGKVLDVVVDVRKNSTTYGRHYKCVLSAETGNMLYIPGGFAHGFAALEPSVFLYKCSAYYKKNAEAGIRYNDPGLGIEWGIDDSVVSVKDKMLPLFSEFESHYEIA